MGESRCIQSAGVHVLRVDSWCGGGSAHASGSPVVASRIISSRLTSLPPREWDRLRDKCPREVKRWALGLKGALVVRIRLGVAVEAGARGWVPVVGVQARDGRGLADGELGGVIGGMAVCVQVVVGHGGLYKCQ